MPNEKTETAEKTILVVDDVELNRSIVNKIFGDTHRVLMAEHGSDAMEILHTQPVDIVLLDIQMPVMDGYEVIRAMKAERRLAEIPILVTTGAIDKSERKAFDLGADDYLTQPYDPYIMRKRVENLIDRYELRAMRHAASEQQMGKNMLEGLEIGYWEWTAQDGYHHSPEYEKYAISAQSDEKIRDPQTQLAYVHPDDVPAMEEFLRIDAESDVRKSSVVRCKMQDGSYRWTEFFTMSDTSATGRPERLVWALRNVDKEWVASRAAEQKNAELNHIIDSTSGGVATYLLKDGLWMVSLSDSLAGRLGYAPAEAESTRLIDAVQFIHPADRALALKNAEDCAKTGTPKVVAYRIAKRDGTYKWFRAGIYSAGESDGGTLLYVVLTDIAEVNADYVEALNQTNEMIFIADWESRDILYCNQAAAKMAGVSISELFGRKCSQIPKHCDEKCKFCSKEELTYDTLYIQAETIGKQHFLKKGKRLLWNGREAYIEYVSDVTAQYNMTEKTVFERNLLSSATKTLFPMCIIGNLTQNDYTIVEYDHQAFPSIHVQGSFDELITLGAATIPEEDRAAFVAAFSRESLLRAYAAGTKIVPLTHRQFADDGVLHWNQTTVVFAEQLLNDDLYVIAFTHNVDEQKKAEASIHAALSEAEHANMAKTAFLSRVSHDMRTPLNGILGLTTILKDEVTDEKIRHDLVELELSGKYLLNLINDTLDVSRIENGKMQLNPSVYDGRDLFNTVLGLVKTNAMSKNIQLNITAKDIPFTMLYVDGGRIEQILLNVVGNAIKFSPENGIVDITLKNVSAKNGVLTDVLEVRDYGTGMSKEFLPHIFESFSQEDTARTSTNQGTGLGMAITKQLVTLMDGEIAVESELGKGSCFTITLKLPTATEEQIDQWKRTRISVDEGIELSGKKILLCEDHPLNTKITTKLLEIKGVKVEHAENGKIGVEMFQNSPDGYYDAVLMDIRMPVMDGLDATKAIRALPRRDARKIPIIAMTANAFAEDIRQTKSAGMNAHLSKPIETTTLYKTLKEMLRVDPDVRRPKVLIVDDMELNRAIIRATLEDDYELMEAENGKQAMKILENTKGMDAIITDIQMPKMDGVELIKQIRSDNKYRHVVIIANTQFGDPQQEEKLLALGANDFVYKPTTPKIVEIRVRNALKRI